MGSPQGPAAFGAGDLLGSGSASLAEQNARLSAEVWSRRFREAHVASRAASADLPAAGASPVGGSEYISSPSALVPLTPLARSEVSREASVLAVEPSHDQLGDLGSISAWAGLNANSPSLRTLPVVNLSFGLRVPGVVTLLGGGLVPTSAPFALTPARGLGSLLAAYPALRARCVPLWANTE